MAKVGFLLQLAYGATRARANIMEPLKLVLHDVKVILTYWIFEITGDESCV